MEFASSISGPGIAMGFTVILLAIGPAVYAAIVSVLAARPGLTVERYRTYRTSPWAYLLVIVCSASLIHLFLFRGVDTMDHVIGGLVSLVAVALLILQSQTLVTFGIEEITVKEGPKTETIEYRNVIRGEIGFVGVSVVHGNGKTVIQWGISRPWQILATLNRIEEEKRTSLDRTE